MKKAIKRTIKEQRLFRMHLHECIEIDNGTVTRVPGGWLYCIHNSYSGTLSTTFVPRSDEFRLLDTQQLCGQCGAVMKKEHGNAYCSTECHVQALKEKK